MARQQYQAAADWFTARPRAKRALDLFRKGCVLAVYLCYGAALAALAWGRSGYFWCELLAPAAAFVLGTALRAAIGRPRPYEALHFTPLFPKATRGQSFPSRHCFAAAAIAVTTLGCCAPLGWALLAVAGCIAVTRVLAGHHYPSDVLAGLGFGAGAALAVCALLRGVCPGWFGYAPVSAAGFLFTVI